MLRLPGIVLALTLASPFAAAAEGDDFHARVNKAIDRGAANLVSRQAEDGSWQREDKVHPMGRTALCSFTLLHAGLPPEHPALRKGLECLGILKDYGCKVEPHSTYEAGCIALLLNALGRGYEGGLHDVCRWLVERFDDSVGLWGYPDGIPDLSNTQFAAMALKAGENRGFETPDRIWKRLVDSVVRMQVKQGAVRYRSGGTVYRATMTHAGLLVLRYAGESLGRAAPARKIREATEAGHRWLEEHYAVDRTPYGRGWHNGYYHYYMWGLERYAVTFGLNTIAGHDWYREGAEELLSRQEKNGSWGSLEQTCFAILFLRRVTLTEPDTAGRPAPAAAAPETGEEKGPPAPPKPDGAVPFIREWLVAGPFPAEKLEDDSLFDTPVDPLRLRLPVPKGPAGKKKWMAYASAEDKVDFKDAPTGGDAWASFLATCYLHAAEDAEAVLWLAADDGIRAWLDGKEILFGHHHDGSGIDFYRVPLSLEKGRHVLLLHVENLEYYVHFHARISDADGKVVEGVSASTDPRPVRRR